MISLQIQLNAAAKCLNLAFSEADRSLPHPTPHLGQDLRTHFQHIPSRCCCCCSETHCWSGEKTRFSSGAEGSNHSSASYQLTWRRQANSLGIIFLMRKKNGRNNSNLEEFLRDDIREHMESAQH